MALKIWVTIWLVALALLIAGAWWWHMNERDEGVYGAQKISAIGHDINECDAIIEKSAANFVPVVEFQKLEMAGRKASVFKICMQDHGYAESATWLQYAKPLAAKVAIETRISPDEALENLRRLAMREMASKANEPAYWVTAKAAKPK